MGNGWSLDQLQERSRRFVALAELILARLFTPDLPNARPGGLGLSLGAWLVLTGFNLVGVSRAGYSLPEELPVFLLLFGVPAAAALVAHRWIS